jgi:dihydroorotase-like cyclic amidohydrolase
MDALPGVLAVETRLPLRLDAAANGRVGFARVLELLCEHPAELVHLGHRKGSLLPGHDADLVLVDMDATRAVRGAELHSLQRFTPYEGRELRGAIEHVFVRGRAVVRDRSLAAEAPFGEHVPSLNAVAAAVPA